MGYSLKVLPEYSGWPSRKGKGCATPPAVSGNSDRVRYGRVCLCRDCKRTEHRSTALQTSYQVDEIISVFQIKNRYRSEHRSTNAKDDTNSLPTES